MNYELSQPHGDKCASNSETEGFMLAIQSNSVTLNVAENIYPETQASPQETIQHITTVWKLLTQTGYKRRHNQVANIIHQEQTLQHKLIDKDTPYYKYLPNTTTEPYWHIEPYNTTDLTLTNTTKAQALYGHHHTRPTQPTKDADNKIHRSTYLAHKNTTPLRNGYGDHCSFLHGCHLTCNTQKPATNRSTRKQIQKATIINTCHIVVEFLSHVYLSSLSSPRQRKSQN